VLAAIFLIFSNLGVNLFSGKFHYCSIHKYYYSS